MSDLALLSGDCLLAQPPIPGIIPPAWETIICAGPIRRRYQRCLEVLIFEALAGNNRTLGIAWHYAPGDDGRADGRHLEWRDDPAWLDLDPQLHAGLCALPIRSVEALEQAAIWPVGAHFHRDPMPPRVTRLEWARLKRDTRAGADLVFLDPDNGLGEATEKHATFSELRLLRQLGRAVAFITFPGRSMKHDALVQHLHDRLAEETGADRILTLRTSVSVLRSAGSAFLVPRQRWFTVIDVDEALIDRATQCADRLNAMARVKAELVAR